MSQHLLPAKQIEGSERKTGRRGQTAQCVGNHLSSKAEKETGGERRVSARNILKNGFSCREGRVINN